MDNNNPKPEIEKILRTCLENLRELAHTPSKPSHLTGRSVSRGRLLPRQPRCQLCVGANWAWDFWQEISLDVGGKYVMHGSNRSIISC